WIYIIQYQKVMEKNKYEFISEILENRKLNQTQRERLFNLAMLEIKAESRKDRELLRKIEEIEEKLNELKNSPNTKLEEPTSLNKRMDGPEPNPKHVADFMSLFNQRNGLKYLTHDYDENDGFKIDNFLISANEIFAEKTKKLNIPVSLWRIVKQFAFDSHQTEWTSISEDY